MSQIGFGIIGCGAIAPFHAEGVCAVHGARLVAVADVDPGRASALAARFGADACPDVETLLRRTDVHAVSLCVPSGLRAELAEACAAAGKHILSEKPLEVTVERVDRMIAAAERAGVALGCVFQSRFTEGARRLKDAVERGRFGRLVLGDAQVKWYRDDDYYARTSWRGTRRMDGGGALMNQGVHQVDLLLWRMGPVRTVRARAALLGHQGLEVEDVACAVIEYENGALGTVVASTAAWPGSPARIALHGDAGTAVLEDGQLREWRFRDRLPEDDAVEAGIHGASDLGSGAGDPLAGLSPEGHRRQIDDFVRALREGRPPAIGGREARHAVAFIEAVYRSAARAGEAFRP